MGSGHYAKDFDATAYEYFFAVGRDASTGMYPTVTVFNFTWLKFTE